MPASTVQDVMTRNPVTIQADQPVTAAARMMREKDIGPIIVMNDGGICGIVTDRDITIRAVADGKDPNSVKIGDICSQDLHTLSPKDKVDDAVQMMRREAIRRLPVVDKGKPVGIVSLGDLAVEKDPKSALADISEAPPNE